MIRELAEACLSLFLLLCVGGLIGILAWPLTDAPTRTPDQTGPEA